MRDCLLFGESTVYRHILGGPFLTTLSGSSYEKKSIEVSWMNYVAAMPPIALHLHEIVSIGIDIFQKSGRLDVVSS